MEESYEKQKGVDVEKLAQKHLFNSTDDGKQENEIKIIAKT